MNYIVYIKNDEGMAYGDQIVESYNTMDDLLERKDNLNLKNNHYAIFKGTCIKGNTNE